MKKQIHNIFSASTKTKQNKIPNPFVPIIIDKRERNSLIIANLVEQKANIEFEQLKIADYLVGETAIERKTFSDFAQSMINKRLQNQLKEIQKHKKYLLIIEGFYYNYSKLNIHENAIRGMLLSTIIDYNVPLIFTEDENDTSKFLILLAKKQEKLKQTTSLRPTKSSISTAQQKQFILEGFPGIGPTTAKKLIEKYQTLDKIFRTDEQEIINLKILDEKKAKQFKELLQS